MLSIKCICKSENNEDVVIINFESEEYCLCMKKDGTIFQAKNEDLIIVDKEYLKSCISQESIQKDLAEFANEASKRLDDVQRQQILSMAIELSEYRNKIEQKKLIELPCKVGDTVYCVKKKTLRTHWDEHWDEWKVCELPFSLTLWECGGIIGKDYFFTREEAEKRLKELQDE